MLRSDLRRVFQRFVRRGAASHRPPIINPESPPVVVIPATHANALARLVDMEQVKSPGFQRRHMNESRDRMQPVMLEFDKAFLKECHRRGLPLILVQGYRGKHEQNTAFKNGFSRARYPQSPHNHGFAGDYIHRTRGYDLEPKEWAVIGLIGKEVARRKKIKVVWGGDWGWDFAHWEIADWRERVQNGETASQR